MLIVGDKVNRLTLITDAYKKEGHGYTKYVRVRCDCGNDKEIQYRQLSGKNPQQSCGCYRLERLREELTKDVDVGKVFGYFTIIKDLGIINRRRVVLANCECGTKDYQVRWDQVISGIAKSCGCYQKERVSETASTHKLSKTKVYVTWVSMKQRCTNPLDAAYPEYGGRGISVCDRWINSFENFLEDMGKPKAGQSIDRIDFNGNYEPSNCRWSSDSVQVHNQRKRKGNCSSEFKGVYFNKEKNKWHCRLYHKGSKIFSKYFETELEAAIAYDEESYKHYGDKPNELKIKQRLNKDIDNGSSK